MTDFDIEIINADLLDLDPDQVGQKCNVGLTDPPYGIGIMGENWDSDIALKAETWAHIGRFLVDGSMFTSYSHSRTCFRMGAAIEDSGFSMHGLVAWLHLQGFCSPARVCDKEDYDNPWYDYRYGSDSLRPVFEPVIVFQKPFDKGNSQLSQVLENNSGVYNIADSRMLNGKHPPNMMVTHHPNCNQDNGCSPHCPSKSVMGKNLDPYAPVFSWDYNELQYAFHCSKPTKDEKELGLEGFEEKEMRRMNAGGFSKDEKFKPKLRKNTHRTVKPISAAKYLSLMFKPPENEKNRLFVPFCGTGSEVVGAMLAGWKRILAVEIDSYYYSMAAANIEFWKDKIDLGWSDIQSLIAHYKKQDKSQMILF